MTDPTIGKGASLKKYHTNNAFREQAKVLHTHSASTSHCVLRLVRLKNSRGELFKHAQ